MITAVPSRPVRLTYFPDYRTTNPYQTLLYAGLEPSMVAAPGTIQQALANQSAAQDCPTHIFHLHWEHQILSDPDITIEGFLDDLARFRDAGGLVIWTLHNLAPHEPLPKEQMADLYKGLISTVDIVQLHSLPAVAAACAHWPIPKEKIRIIPHGNYAGRYQIIQRAPARKELNLENAGMVVLLPGRIARYKCPEALIAAFLEIGGPDDHLILAGHLANGITLNTNDDPRIQVLDGFASEQDVSRLHACADIVALPYAESLTSGSAVLAATLGRGVLGPYTPGLRDAVDHGLTGFLYDPARENALRDALASALAEGPDIWNKRGLAAAKSSQARESAIVASAWNDLIAGLCASSHQHQSRGRI